MKTPPKIIVGRYYEVMNGFKERHNFEHGEVIKCIRCDSNGRGGVFKGWVKYGDISSEEKRFDTQHMNDYELKMVDETFVSIWNQEAIHDQA